MGDPVAALPRLREAVNPAVPVTELLSLDDQVAAESTSIRLGALVLECAAGVALFLAGPRPVRRDRVPRGAAPQAEDETPQ